MANSPNSLFDLTKKRILRVVDGATFDSRKVEVVATFSDRFQIGEDDYGNGGEWYKQKGYVTRNVAGVLYGIAFNTPVGGGDEEIEVWNLAMEQAIRLCEQKGADIIVDFFELPPEAKPAEKVESFLVRMPSSLKQDLASYAQREKVSMNEAAVQCLQRCFSERAQ